MRKKLAFILGDFNDNLLASINEITKLIKNVKLTQVLYRLTRIASTSATLIDLMITNKQDIITSPEVVPSLVADHELISVILNISKSKRQPVYQTLGASRTIVNITFANHY